MSKIKKTLIEIVSLNGVSVTTLPLTLAVSIVLVVAYIKNVNFNMTVFYERAIGPPSINNVDALIRVNVFWTCIAVFVLSFLLGSFIADRTKKYLESKFPERSFAMEKTLIFEFGILLLLNEIIYLHEFVKKIYGNRNYFLPLIFAFGVVCLHALISIYRAHKNLNAETHLQSALAFLIPIPLTYFALLVLSSGTPVIPIISIKSAAIYTIFYFLLRFMLNDKINSCAAAYALVPLSFLPMAYIIANEAQYTLTKHGIIISPKVIALGIYFLLGGIALFAYLLKRKNNSEEFALKKIENIVLPVLLVTAGIFVTHYQVISPNFDLLHNGNKTLPAQQLLQFGNLPLLDIWEHQNLPLLPFLYGILNGLNFLEQNIWLDMSYMIVNILICYFVLRQFMSARWAALLVLFTPIIVYANQYYLAGLLPLIYLRKMRERRGSFDYGVFFALALVAFVYHSSSGFIAVIAVLVMIAMSCSSKKNIIDAIKGVLITLSVPAVVYFSLVILRGENILDRLVWISKLGSTNILIGAYSSLVGGNRTPFEILVYLGIFPLLSIVSTYLVLRAKDKTTSNYGIVFITVATIICSLRGLGRHSLVESLPQDYYPLLFVLVPLVLIKCKTKAKIMSSFVIAVLLITPYAATGYGIAAYGVKDFTFNKFEAGDERCDTLNNPAYPSNLKKVLDTVLTDDQTFFETINGHLLFALMERKQIFMPGATQLIQYERQQAACIRTLEKLYRQNKVPIIITGQSDWWGCAIDGIPSELSLFKLEEWIYAHYEPGIWVDGFHLWRAKNSGIELLEGIDSKIFTLADVPFSNWNMINDIKTENNNDILTLKCGNNDPQISFPLEKETDINVTDGHTAKLMISYKSSVKDSLQIFYDFYGYNEADSSRVRVNAATEFETVFAPVPASKKGYLLKAVRIDPPDGATFEINSISIIESSMPAFYTAKNTIKQDFNMVMLPYVWGNYDKKVNKRFPKEQQRIAYNLPLEAGNPVTLALDPQIDKSSGNYIYFRINSQKSGTLTLSYGDDLINSCTFNFVAGEYDYLVRISSQYNWMSKPQTSMDIKSDVSVSLQRVSILKGD